METAADGVREVGPGSDSAWAELLRTHPLARSVVPVLEEVAGWTNHRLGLFRGGALAGGMIAGLRRIPRTPFRLARATCLMAEPAGARELLEAFERFGRERGVVEWELRLRIPDGDAIPGFEFHRELKALFADAGFGALSKAEGTYVVRIDREDDAILGSFASDCRSHVRKAAKEGAHFEPAAGESAFEEFWAATEAMVERKSAPTQGRRALVEGMVPLWRAGQVQLFRAGYGGRVANMAITDTLGIPTDIAAARSPENVRGELPSAGQFLQFCVMKRMRDQGRVWYDLGGCEGPEPVEGHPNYGVWKYKSRYKGTYVTFLPWYRKARSALARRVLGLVHRWRGDYT
jgi:hypothetical protein